MCSCPYLNSTTYEALINYGGQLAAGKRGGRRIPIQFEIVKKRGKSLWNGPVGSPEKGVNIVVVGKNATILVDTGNTVYFVSFTPYYQALDKLLIVYAEVQYMCKYTENIYIAL